MATNDGRSENKGLSVVDAPLLTLDGFHEVSRACSKARRQSNGWKSHRQSIPVAVVVISSVEKGDRLDGSLEVKVPMAGKLPKGMDGSEKQFVSAAFRVSEFPPFHDQH